MTMITMTKPRSLRLFLAPFILALPHHHASSFITPSSAGVLVTREAVGFVFPPSPSTLDATANDAADDNAALSSSLSTASPEQQHQQPTQQHRRRDVLASFISMTRTAGVVAFAALPVPSAYAGSLLEDYGADPTVNKQPDKTKELARNKGKIESSMEPNLRSNYYYPTNKVRYLPRIKKCSDAIPSVALAIGDEDWDSVRDFANVVADDTILPMKLYVSSLTGGGTNVKVGFAKDMMSSAKAFEKQQSLLVKSVDKRDAAKASSALEGMAEAMLSYRTIGKLLGPDGGGDIPSVDEIRRSTKRFRGEAFEAKVKERDARVKAAAEASKE